MKYTTSIERVFAAVFFLVPLIFFPKTSEVFEFNKLLAVYVGTIAIVSVWALEMISERRFVLRRTFLDIPILIFLFSQLISVILSIDPRTSFLGYYSRWNGGFLSLAAYAVLYWAYVTHVDGEGVKRHVKVLLFSSVVAALWAISEHFGASPSCIFITGEFNNNCWVQDVQSRPFSTFGQPNWLAAWLVAIIPLTWAAKFINLKSNLLNQVFYVIASAILFAALLYTNSRSGLLGFAVAFGTFWGFNFIFNFKGSVKKFLIYVALFSALFLLANGPELLGRLPGPADSGTRPVQSQVQAETVLQTGGTESGDIRRIVWRGGVDLWRAYPVFGTGVETFALSYYQTRPAEHNLTSEWNYLYNKAHNEYLNFAATTGTVGLLAYLTLIIFSLLQISKNKFLIDLNKSQLKNPKTNHSLEQLGQLEIRNFRTALLAGFASILVTNFFGFSVVPTALLFFLFPAMASSVNGNQKLVISKIKFNNYQKALAAVVLLITSYLLLVTVRYWRADYNFAQGHVAKAVKAFPNEPTYRIELARLSAQDGDVGAAISELRRAKSLSPKNVKFLKMRVDILIDIAKTGHFEVLPLVLETLEELTTLAPTDPSVYYETGIAHGVLGNEDEAIAALDRALGLKPDYGAAKRLKEIILEPE